jgi:hypothetical protein
MTKNANVSDLYQYGQKTDKNFKNAQLGFLEPNKSDP